MDGEVIVWSLIFIFAIGMIAQIVSSVKRLKKKREIEECQDIMSDINKMIQSNSSNMNTALTEQEIDDVIEQHDLDDNDDNEEIVITDKEIDDFIFQEVENRVREIEGKPKNEYEKLDDSFAEIARNAVKRNEIIVLQSRAPQIVEQLEAAGILYSGKIFAPCKKEEYLEKRITKALTDGLYIEKDDFSYYKYYETKEQSEKRKYFNEYILPSKEEYIDERVKHVIEINEIMKENELKEKLKQELLDEEKKKNEKLKKKRMKEKLKAEMTEQGLLSSDDIRKRESIPQDIQDRVWNRDGGKCVKCGSQEKLEFDHIIPFSKGGSNTYRNLQILCEKCNREKNNNIGV